MAGEPESDIFSLPTPIELQIDSPPPVLVGFPNDAKDVPVSGQLKLRLAANCSQMAFTQIRVSVVQVTKVKRGSAILKGLYTNHKATAASGSTELGAVREETEELTHWNAPTQMCILSIDQNATQRASFDFILQIPGYVSATMNTPIVGVSYNLIATAKVNKGGTVQTRFWLPVQRVIPCSNPPAEKTFLRCYPDIRLRSNVTVPAVINPTGPFPVTLLFRGLVVQYKNTYSRLAIRKCKWRVNEVAKIVSTSRAELPSSGAHNQHEMKHYMREIARGKCGGRWSQASDFQISYDFEIVLPESAHTSCHVPLCPEHQTLRQRVNLDVAGVSQGLPSCTLNSPKRAISITHVLIVEFAVVEEVYNNNTGKRVNLEPWQMPVYGCTNQIYVARRGVDLTTEGPEFDSSELLPMYLDSSNERPPPYEVT
jgi:hypothetical protein